MFYLIEDKTQLETLYEKEIKTAIVEVIPFNDLYHPNLNKVSLIYVKDVDRNKGYILGHKHNDSLSLLLGDIRDYIQSIDSVYVRDKKSFLYYFPIKKVIELDFKEYKNNNKTYNFYYHNHSELFNLNSIIPLVKHYERMNSLFTDIKLPEEESFYSRKASLAFLGIEKNGIKIDESIFEGYFEPQYSNYSIFEGKIYTQYNLNTLTKRPSNAFNGINFSALNKTNKCRKAFIPENDLLIELDISAYHPALIANLINYDFKGQDIHQHFADLYGVSYKESKEITFKQLYGNIFEKYKDLEFFKMTQTYINNRWEEFNECGFITTNSGYKISHDIDNQMTPNKLFNYIIQEEETFNNVDIIWQIIKILNGAKSKIVLTVYDSFIFDFLLTEIYLIENISKVFELKGLKIKRKNGLNYNF